MALLQNKTVNGVAINGCYIKVQSVSGNKDSVGATVTFSATSEDQPFHMEYVEFTPNLEGGNFIKQAYENIKSLPDFAGAIDC